MPNLPVDNNARAVQCLQPLSTSELAFSGSGQQTAAYTGVLALRMIADADCHILISAAPGAAVAATDMLMTSGVPEYFSISDGLRVGALQDSASGTLNITVMV